MRALSHFDKYWLILAIFIVGIKPLMAQNEPCEVKRLANIFFLAEDLDRYKKGDTTAGNYQIKADLYGRPTGFKYQNQSWKNLETGDVTLIYYSGDIIQITLIGKNTQLYLAGQEIREKVPELTEKIFRSKIIESGLVFEFYNDQNQRYFGFYDKKKNTFCRSAVWLN